MKSDSATGLLRQHRRQSEDVPHAARRSLSLDVSVINFYDPVNAKDASEREKERDQEERKKGSIALIAKDG